jgi:hypothetical protein
MTDTTQEELPIWVSTAPTDICLGLYWDGGSDEEHAGFPDNHEDICWSEGKNGHGDDNVHYVRADIANQCIATLKAENAEWKRIADQAHAALAENKGAVHWKERAEAAQSQAAQDVETLTDLTVHLIAAVDLLERGGKKAAASDKMFAQMLLDYKASIERGRAAIRAAEWKKSRVYFGWNTTHMK